MKSSSFSSKGFTIIELVIVTILLGILAIVALPRLFDQTGFQESGFYQDVINAFRYAQKTAIASGCDVQASYNSGTRQYAVYFRSGGSDTSCGAGGFSEFVRAPQDNSNYTGTGPSGISTSGALSVVFDAAGSPSTSGSFDIGNKTITVAPVTGYVY